MANHCIYKICPKCGIAYCELCGDRYKASRNDIEFMESEICPHCEFEKENNNVPRGTNKKPAN